MKTWELTEEDELQLAHGEIMMKQELEALRVRIDAALEVIKGEVDDETVGVDYFGIVFSNTPISMKVQEISRVILLQDGVDDVEFNNAVVDRRTGALHFSFTIYSVYGEFDYDKTFENMA